MGKGPSLALRETHNVALAYYPVFNEVRGAGLLQNRPRRCTLAVKMERVKGIEPSYSAWEGWRTTHFCGFAG